jgi:hypothetical protein
MHNDNYLKYFVHSFPKKTACHLKLKEKAKAGSIKLF